MGAASRSIIVVACIAEALGFSSCCFFALGLVGLFAGVGEARVVGASSLAIGVIAFGCITVFASSSHVASVAFALCLS